MIKTLVTESGFCTESIHQNWSSVELYNRYRFTYEVIIVAVLTYLLEVLTPEQLIDPTWVMKEADTKNPGQPLSACETSSIVMS